jgi:type III restriction enzyme
VAITDHHDFVFVDYIRDAAAEETDEAGDQLPDEALLTVFPGLELSLTVPCQALLVLDADFPTERLSSVLEQLRIEVADPEAKKHTEPKELDFDSLGELHEHLDKNSWLKGRYALLPNVTDGGLGTLLRKKMQSRYKEMPCVGGYLDGSVENQGKGPTGILAGENKEWGNKRIAVFQTSDSRSANFKSLGVPSTWIKWAEPTAEALRQACLAQESRISHIDPQLPGTVVTELRVSNSKFLGPIGLAINPQYNALIGGRGTGKSTCLEYLRWALCDQPPELADDDDMPNHAARRARLIEQTLEPFGANIEVDFVLNGISHMIRRYAETGRVQLKIGDRELKDATPEEIRALLPIEAYSQRQLSSVGVRLDELTRFVTAPIRERLGETATKAEEIAAQARQNYADLQRQRALERTVSQENLALASLTQQAKNMREGLTGLKDEDRDCLAQRPGYEEAGQPRRQLGSLGRAGRRGGAGAARPPDQDPRRTRVGRRRPPTRGQPARRNRGGGGRRPRVGPGRRRRGRHRPRPSAAQGQRFDKRQRRLDKSAESLQQTLRRGDRALQRPCLKAGGA